MESPLHHPLRLLGAAVLVAFSATTMHARATAQEDAEDIRDKPVDKVARKLYGRGYKAVGAYTARDGGQYWWNRDKDRCLELQLRKGRVSQAEVRDEKTCRDANKHHGAQPGHIGSHDYSGLEGMRAGSLDHEMESRGFRDAGGHKDDDASFTHWWNKSTRECLSVATRNGRVDKVKPVSEGKCR